jgi:hypothetical protein
MLSLLCGIKFDEPRAQLSIGNESFYHDLFENKFEKLLETNKVNNLVVHYLRENMANEFDLGSIQRLITENADIKEHDLVVCGIACLQLFVQSNWLGPMPAEVETFNEDFNEKLKPLLEFDGESLLHAHNLYLLLIARVLFIDLFQLIEAAEVSR